MRRSATRGIVLIVVVMLLSPSPAAAQQAHRSDRRSPAAATDVEDPASARASRQAGEQARLADENTATGIVNELADLFQIPIVHNFEWGLGAAEGGFRYLLTARPRIPIHLAGDWMLVTTGFMRFNFVDDVLAPDGTGKGSFVGMGDTDVYALLTPPRLVEGLLFGLGQFVILPSGNPRFGTVNVGFGPGGAVTWQSHGVVLSVIILHAFSFVDDDTDYSQTQILASVSYVFDTATAIVVQSETVLEWHSEIWIVPLSVGVTQVLNPGPLLRMNVGILGKWWPVSPVGGPDWGVRVVTTLLFPELDALR